MANECWRNRIPFTIAIFGGLKLVTERLTDILSALAMRRAKREAAIGERNSMALLR
jgi:hypothetical protein